MTLWNNIAYIVNAFVVSLQIIVMINILQEVIKILHEEMFNAMNLYWFHNDASDKNNPLNGYCKEPRINKQKFVIFPAKWNLLVWTDFTDCPDVSIVKFEVAGVKTY